LDLVRVSGDLEFDFEGEFDIDVVSVGSLSGKLVELTVVDVLLTSTQGLGSVEGNIGDLSGVNSSLDNGLEPKCEIILKIFALRKFV
jgi:hypothetical protein